MMFLGLITCNVFATARLLWLHGKFPKRRPDDPTAAQALLRAFIPFYNLYWAPFALGRLLTRLNEQRREWGLPELRLNGLLAALVVCMFGPGLAIIALRPLLFLLFDDAAIAQGLFFAMPVLNWFVFVPLFATAVQNGANALAEASAARQAAVPAAFLVQTELKWRARQRLAWGTYLAVVAGLHMTVIGVVLLLQRKTGDEGFAFLMNVLVISLPLSSAAGALFVRAGIMSARRARLEQEPAQAAAVVAAERRTTRIYQFAWSGVFALVGLVLFGVLVTRAILPGGVTAYQIVEDILPMLLFLVLPTSVAALHLWARAIQGTGGLDEPETAPVLSLQARPMSWWPSLAGAGLLVLLLVVSTAWQRYERRSNRFAVADSVSRPAQSRPPEPKRPPELASRDEPSEPAPWKAPSNAKTPAADSDRTSPKEAERLLRLADIIGTWDGPDFSLFIEAGGKGRAGFFVQEGGKRHTLIGYYTVDTTNGAPRIAFKLSAAKDQNEFEFLAISKPTADTLVVKETKHRIKPNPITLNRRKEAPSER